MRGSFSTKIPKLHAPASPSVHVTVIHPPAMPKMESPKAPGLKLSKLGKAKSGKAPRGMGSLALDPQRTPSALRKALLMRVGV